MESWAPPNIPFYILVCGYSKIYRLIDFFWIYILRSAPGAFRWFIGNTKYITTIQVISTLDWWIFCVLKKYEQIKSDFFLDLKKCIKLKSTYKLTELFRSVIFVNYISFKIKLWTSRDCFCDELLLEILEIHFLKLQIMFS